MCKKQKREQRHHIYRVDHLRPEECHKIQRDQGERYKIHIFVSGTLHHIGSEHSYEKYHKKIAVSVEFRKYIRVGIKYREEQDEYQRERQQGIASPKQELRSGIAEAVFILCLVRIKELLNLCCDYLSVGHYQLACIYNP